MTPARLFIAILVILLALGATDPTSVQLLGQGAVAEEDEAAETSSETAPVRTPREAPRVDLSARASVRFVRKAVLARAPLGPGVPSTSPPSLDPPRRC